MKRALRRLALFVVLPAGTLTAQPSAPAAPQTTEEVILEMDSNSAKEWISGIAYHLGGSTKILWMEKASAGARQYVLDGRVLGRYNEGTEVVITLNPKGQVVYVVPREKNKWVVLVENEERSSIEAEGVAEVLFDGQGEAAGYKIFTTPGKKWQWIIRGEKGPEFHSIGRIRLYGKSFIYAGSNVTRGFNSHLEGSVVVNSKQEQVYTGSVMGEEEHLWMRDGLPMWVAANHGVGDPAVTEDGKHGYAVHRGKDDEAVVINGEPGPTFEAIAYGPWFSRDGQHFAYVATKDKGKTLLEVHDHKVTREMPLHDWNSHWSFLGAAAFSADLSRFAFVLGKHGTAWKLSLAHRRVVVDGKEEEDENCWLKSGLLFSPDGRHLVYHVMPSAKALGPHPTHYVIDGRQGKGYDEIIRDSSRFLDNHTFEYIARDKNKLVRVTTRLD
jgi:hypothetical protein